MLCPTVKGDTDHALTGHEKFSLFCEKEEYADVALSNLV